MQKKKQTPVAIVLADEQKEKDTPSSDPVVQLERRHSKGRQFMNLIKNPFSSSSSNSHSAKFSHIQSAAMTDDDKTKSLAVFHLDGLDLATTRTDAFMQDSWKPEPILTKQEVKKSDKPTHAQKLDEPPKKKGLPPKPPAPFQKLFDDADKVKPPLAQRNSVQSESDSNHLKKPRRPVQRSHSSAGSTGSNRIKIGELNQPPPAIAPRNYRPTSRLSQGLKKPLVPPVTRSSTKLHNHTGNESEFS